MPEPSAAAAKLSVSTPLPDPEPAATNIINLLSGLNLKSTISPFNFLPIGNPDVNDGTSPLSNLTFNALYAHEGVLIADSKSNMICISTTSRKLETGDTVTCAFAMSFID